MPLHKNLQNAWIALRHPAFLFSVGNTALAVGEAEPVAITVNVLLVLVLFFLRFNEVRKSGAPGATFTILAAVNLFTAFSVEFNRAMGTQGSKLFAEGMRHLNLHDVSSAVSTLQIHNLLSTDKVVLAAHISALAYVAWAIGHLYAGRHEKNKTAPKGPGDNPQLYYGIGDISAINASGSINPYAVVIMILGFMRSAFVGRTTQKAKRSLTRFVRQSLTAPRLYGLSYLVGAVSSLSLPHFAIAQIFWALAYFQFN